MKLNQKQKTSPVVKYFNAECGMLEKMPRNAKRVLALMLAAALAAAAATNGLAEDLHVTEKILPNGLKVLLKEEHKAQSRRSRSGTRWARATSVSAKPACPTCSNT
jgi:hypothetical protein